MQDFSLRVVRLEAFTEETGASFYEGTGWFAKLGNAKYLVSNYHILSGTKVSDFKAFHRSAARPGRIKVHCRLTKEISNDESGSRRVSFMDCNFDLDLKDHTVRWNADLRSDVAAIEITQICAGFPDGYTLEAWDLKKLSKPSKNLEVMDDLFIIGFPQTALSRQTNFPIYKSASVASEPEATRDSGFFLADGKTKSGMSGSPVIVKDGLVGTPSATGFDLNIGNPHLIGIYSGRDEDDPKLFEAELGRIWLIDETLRTFL